MQEAFTFNIHEAVAFDKEQQIQEMLGIGLEPVISMEEIGNTLSVRGVMELKGEYIRNDAPEESEERQTNATYVERVESLSDEVNEFFHKFLIDVSIPMDRIPSLDDVSIEVDHFDYSLESTNEMFIEATLAIQGIEEPEVQAEIQEEDTLPSFEENRIEEQQEEDTEDTFHVKVEEELDDHPDEEKVVAISSMRSDQEIAEEDDSIEEEQEEELVRESEEDVVLESEEEEEEEGDEEDEEDDKLHVQAREERANDTTYLLNIFAEEEEASYTRLKLYIVQPDDQMQTIAERYQVSPRQIMRTNRLEEDDVSAGQLIYIPIISED